MLDKKHENTLKYRIASSLLESLYKSNLITKDEMKEIDKLNQESFEPEHAEIYN